MLSRHRETHLLAQADSWPSVERKEDEGVLHEIFLETLIEETVGVKLLGYVTVAVCVSTLVVRVANMTVPSGPQRSLRLCIMNTEYGTLQTNARNQCELSNEGNDGRT